MESAPAYGYVAYIDESGDDGLTRVKPCDNPGSSEWLVISAVVISSEQEAQVTKWARDMLALSKTRQRTHVHFKDLTLARKAAVCEYIATLPLRCFVVCSNKKNMRGHKNPAAAQIPSKNWFYCWMTRLLLERVTHFVEQRGAKAPGHPNLLKIEYSERGGLSYGQMKAYYDWLRIKSGAGNLYLPMGDLSWSVMDLRLMEVHSHLNRAGLQLADAVAGAFFKSSDIYDTGACDASIAKALRPRMARVPDMGSGQIAGYGVKLLPGLKKAALLPEQAEIFSFYGYPKQWWAPALSAPEAF